MVVDCEGDILLEEICAVDFEVFVVLWRDAIDEGDFAESIDDIFLPGPCSLVRAWLFEPEELTFSLFSDEREVRASCENIDSTILVHIKETDHMIEPSVLRGCEFKCLAALVEWLEDDLDSTRVFTWDEEPVTKEHYIFIRKLRET